HAPGSGGRRRGLGAVGRFHAGAPPRAGRSTPVDPDVRPETRGLFARSRPPPASPDLGTGSSLVAAARRRRRPTCSRKRSGRRALFPAEAPDARRIPPSRARPVAPPPPPFH